MNHQDRIVREKSVCGGEPIFRGTRVTVRTVLASLADGNSVDAILADFPTLKAEDVQAAVALAAAEFFNKRAGNATVAGMMRFLRNAPKAAPEPEDALR
jgi:uncharacterized protein (DUF433 family)